jgi:hypothetical protein
MESDHSEDLCLHSITDHQEIGWGCMDWIYLAQDMDTWRSVVHAVMSLLVP